MFGVLYRDEDGLNFKVFKEQIDASNFANNMACMATEVTVFDYEVDSQTYLEFYKI